MFKFELNSVLSLKEKMEDSKKRELGVANTHKERLEQIKDDLMNEHDGVYDAIKKNVCIDFDVKEVRLLNQYSLHIKKQIKQTQNDIHKAQKTVDQKRDELLDAVKERKILENLKEIKREHYMIESKKTEQLLVDEMVSYKYGKVRRSGG